MTLYINIMAVRARVLRDDRCIFPAVRRASEVREGGDLMELRHPLSGDMAVLKVHHAANPRSTAALVHSHLSCRTPPPSTRQSAVTRSPQKVVWPQRAHLRRHHHHGAKPPARAWRIVCRPDPLFSPGGREARRDRQNTSNCTLSFRTRRLHSVQFRRRRIRDPPPVLKLPPPPLLSTSRHAIYRSPSFPPSSLPDIPDIPENIKGCQALQIVDFSSNPIPR